jgi:hypothetical protein
MAPRRRHQRAQPLAKRNRAALERSWISSAALDINTAFAFSF